MKVPKMYKSSDLYDAGTDVIYDDDSKLQYAPFIYATTGSGDSGDGGNGDGDDVEGEEVMVVNYELEHDTIDKSYKELKEAVASGKVVMLIRIPADDESAFIEQVLYLTYLTHQSADSYIATFTSSNFTSADTTPGLLVYAFEASAEGSTMEKIYPMPH